MAPVPVQTNGGSPAALNERLHQVQRQLIDERRRTARSTTLVVIIGILALLLLGGYFAYGYSEIKKNTSNELLLSFAEQEVQNQLPRAREAVAEEIKKSAPEWARMLSQQAQENLPTARQKLEEHALEQCDGMLKEASLMTTEQFRRFLRDNRQTLEAGFKDLAKSPKLADQTLADIEKSLDKELQTSMRGQAGELLNTLRSANAKLTRLRDSPRLTAEEHMERRIIMLARRLELQQLSPELANRPVPAKPPREPGLEPESVPSSRPALSQDQLKKMKEAMGAQRKKAPPAPPKAGDAPATKGTAAPAKDKTAKDKEASEKKP
jgi:hypothetical protein